MSFNITKHEWSDFTVLEEVESDSLTFRVGVYPNYEQITFNKQDIKAMAKHAGLYPFKTSVKPLLSKAKTITDCAREVRERNDKEMTTDMWNI